MATVLRDEYNSDQKTFGRESPKSRQNAVPRIRERQDALEVSEVMFMIDDSRDYHRVLPTALEAARKFSARIVIVYATKKTSVPRGLAEFAKAERLMDYEANYYDSLGAEKIQALGQEIEMAGIPWTSRVYLGSMRKAVDSCELNKKAILVVLGTSRSRGLGRLFSFGEPSKEHLANLAVPVLVS